MSENRCKNCIRFKRLSPIEKLGTCEVVANLHPLPDDADRRIIHYEVMGFPFNKSKVWIGENFGCIYFTSIKK